MTGKTAYKNNWQKENVDRVNLTMAKGRKEVVKAHADKRGESLNGFINRAIDCQIERDTSQEAAERPISHFECAGVSLSSKTLKAVQKASEATGETQTEFVTRSVGVQIQRDKATLKLGINPATGDKLEREA